jgi:hypothetical protein
VVASSELAELKKTHVVGSTTRNDRGVRVRVVGESPPGANARQAAPTLEDAYLYMLNADENATSHE